MSTEVRARILQMVAEGKLSAEEAARLLEASEPELAPARLQPPQPPAPPNPTTISKRSLVIQVTEGGEQKVHVRIPFGLARAAGRFIPRQAQRHLEEYDINLQQLMEDLGDSLVAGPLIQIRDVEDEVLIMVE